MTTRHFQMGNAADMTTGLGREAVSKITWAEVAQLKGIQKACVLHDMERMSLQAQVRVNLDLLAKWRKGMTGVPFHAGENYGEYFFTGEWTNVPVGVASLLDVRRREEPILGAGTMRGIMINDGYGGKIHAEETVPAADLNMFEIRMANEGRLVVAVS